ncbi:MAG: ammonium transporter [Gammaproteobacteria bacterium]|uniref:Ammonium transporter n=1 Tax=SAR86 cluster bacterium TaxID=2030880 RepID=A0A520LR87_9GAMM|nr:ammonium transporter [Pseudomonadota bacterium]MDC0244441.1 ammonium transporter [Pseudomonadota bacterium]RZO11176.1 MAG: ammonium transporter [SAR86 cluster bacterium]
MEEIKFALDTFYAIMSGALVMWMAAGFTMLEAGLVQKKDVSEIVTKNLGLFSIACVMYLVCGFALMYPADAIFAIAGGLDEAGEAVSYGILPAIATSWGLSADMPLEEIGMAYGMDYSQQADFFFQVVFVATAMSIVSGAVAGRMKLIPFFIFTVILTAFIYPVQGYWNWGGGFLSVLGYSDYAGSGTVHLLGAAAALGVVTLLGARNGKYGADGSINPMPGSNIPLAALGVLILWLGWFGFNGGSELVISDEASAIAVSQVFLNTNMAAAGGVIGALVLSLVMTGKSDVTMVINGAIAGLVAITAGPSAPSGGESVIIGFLGGLLVYASILFFDSKLKVDDPVGAISAHGIVGIFGVMVVPFTNPDASYLIQLVGVISIAGFGFMASYGAVYLINMITPIRATDEEQALGLDASEIGVEAYPEFK